MVSLIPHDGLARTVPHARTQQHIDFRVARLANFGDRTPGLPHCRDTDVGSGKIAGAPTSV
jgi:hypothetical protein